jgi:hypothetical protein
MSHDQVTRAALLALALAALPLAGASAQIARPEPAPLSAPDNPNAAPPEKVAPPLGAREDSGGSGISTSDRLSRSKGVIKPPSDVDPGMAAPAPDTGAHSMPVLPPPGTGSDRSVEPK